MRRNRLLAATLAAVLAVTALAPMGAAAATTVDGELTVSVSQEDDVVVTVAANETVANASVDVTVDDENASYEGAGDDYVTGEDGTVVLPEPEEAVTVTVVASADTQSAETTATLEPATDAGLALDVAQDGADVLATVTADGEGVANASVSAAAVDENVSYAAGGTTDENGTAVLEAPTGNESVEVVVEASADGETVETTTTLEPVEPAEEQSFGSIVSAFVEDAKNDSDADGPLGQLVASFVVENNPGNAPDHAGPPGADDEKKGNQGPPEHAGGPSDDEKKGNGGGNGNGNGGGPPAHAGPGK